MLRSKRSGKDFQSKNFFFQLHHATCAALSAGPDSKLEIIALKNILDKFDQHLICARAKMGFPVMRYTELNLQTTIES